MYPKRCVLIVGSMIYRRAFELTLHAILVVSCCGPLRAQIDFGEPKEVAADGTLYFARGAMGDQPGWNLYQTGPELILDPLDLNVDGAVNVEDVTFLCRRVASGRFGVELDLNQDGELSLLDVDRFPRGVGSVRGDIDLDGDVDFADFTEFSSHFGISASRWSRGDFDGDRQTALSDFLSLSANFGDGVAGARTVASVPEPGNGCLAYLALVLLWLRNRRIVPVTVWATGCQRAHRV